MDLTYQPNRNQGTLYTLLHDKGVKCKPIRFRVSLVQ